MNINSHLCFFNTYVNLTVDVCLTGKKSQIIFGCYKSWWCQVNWYDQLHLSMDHLLDVCLGWGKSGRKDIFLLLLLLLFPLFSLSFITFSSSSSFPFPLKKTTMATMIGPWLPKSFLLINLFLWSHSKMYQHYYKFNNYVLLMTTVCFLPTNHYHLITLQLHLHLTAHCQHKPL